MGSMPIFLLLKRQFLDTLFSSLFLSVLFSLKSILTFSHLSRIYFFLLTDYLNPINQTTPIALNFNTPFFDFTLTKKPATLRATVFRHCYFAFFFLHPSLRILYSFVISGLDFSNVALLYLLLFTAPKY